MIFAGERVIHQITKLLVVVLQATGEKTLAGLGHDGVADQPRFIATVTEATRRFVGAEVELAEQVVGAHERRRLSQLWVGFDQITALRIRALHEHAVRAFRQPEGRGSRRVDCGERHTFEVHRGEADLLHAIGVDMLDTGNGSGGLGDSVGAMFAQVDVDAADRVCLVAGQGTCQLTISVVV